ncbi:cilia- and flagella-associated protein 45 isoform X1 [Alligator mississippiensis]|uniref:cilia- and flagella-associated protein 45 isoform X1 n=1 Tax=Alligator mississippiensis TaxID=8496 RepID=UPI002877B9A4|nr:cilia- and flagella-associated protein 45 isoform X1 [Alligator mississippiensis]
MQVGVQQPGASGKRTLDPRSRQARLHSLPGSFQICHNSQHHMWSRSGRRAQLALYSRKRSQAMAAQGLGLAPWGSRSRISTWLLAAWAVQSMLPSWQDALRVKQHQEAKETEWLYREMEAMLKQSHLERASVIQAQQNRSSFQQILREQALKEQRQQEKWATQRMVDAKDIQHQMQKYQEKLACERVVSFEDKKHLQKERQWHADHIAQLKRQRIEELRATSPPEKYCLGVECVGLMKPGPKDRGSLRTAQPMPGDFQGVMCGLPPA